MLDEIAEPLDIHPSRLIRALEANVDIGRVIADENEAAELGLAGVPALVLTPDRASGDYSFQVRSHYETSSALFSYQR